MLSFLYPSTWLSLKSSYGSISPYQDDVAGAQARQSAHSRGIRCSRRRTQKRALKSRALIAATLCLASAAQVQASLEIHHHIGRGVQHRQPLHRHLARQLQDEASTSSKKGHARKPSASTAELAQEATATDSSLPWTLTAANEVTASPVPAAPSDNITTYPIVNPQVVQPSWTFPQPFDTTLSTNFTSLSCPSFFNAFIQSPAFQECKPLSMLINTSNAFFNAQRNATTVLPYVMDQICAAPDSCSGTMEAFANRMQQPDACQADLAAGNALAISALNGFLGYSVMRKAGCLVNPTDSNNCFVDAVASGDPTQLYWYYLSSGTPLPSGTKSDCGPCQQEIMQTFSTFATNASLPISKTYPSARTLVNSQCGVSFAPLVASVSAASKLSVASLSFVSFAILTSSFYVSL